MSEKECVGSPDHKWGVVGEVSADKGKVFLLLSPTTGTIGLGVPKTTNSAQAAIAKHEGSSSFSNKL